MRRVWPSLCLSLLAAAPGGCGSSGGGASAGAGEKAGGGGASGQGGSGGLAGSAGGPGGSGGGGGSAGGAGGAGGAGSSGAGGSGAGAAGASGSSGAGGMPHVVIDGGAVVIDGKPTFLYGGDLHYFRVRDADYDAGQTHAMWGETMDLMLAAGMNLVTTYAPWDFHNTSEGVWDFTGARDLGLFLQMACDRKMYVVLKPGPLITAEWPRGFGTYGAVPAWWKQAHPEALVRNAKGGFFTASPTGDASQQQATYLHPTYLAAVKDWFDHVMPLAKPLLGSCLVGVQVDNETNLYWGNRYGDVDYSPTALAHYRAWLAARYGTIDALNARYGQANGSFDEVAPPSSAPGSSPSERPRNPWYADWYWAGQAYVGDYLAQIKQMLVAEGFAPPDVLHFTNDSPFTLLFDDLQIRNVLVHDGPTKNPIGTTGLDLYPKQFTTNGELQDQPFQADYFTRLYEHYGHIANGPQRFAYAAELQGGFFAYPVIGQPKVRPEATSQLLARSIGRGLKGGSFYVIRDGLNADGGAYDYASAIRLDGSTSPRYDVMKQWGKVLAQRGGDLLTAEEVKNRIAVLTNGRYAAPQGGIYDDLQRLTTVEQPALFGWLAAAGLNPEVLDARLVKAVDLANQYKVVFYQNPDFVDDDTAQMLTSYAASGGLLVGLLWPGRMNQDFASSPAVAPLAQSLFPAKDEGSYEWLLDPSRSGDFNSSVGGHAGTLRSYWYESFWSQPAGVPLVPFAWERRQPFGGNGKIVGYVTADAAPPRVFLGTSVHARYNEHGYYTESPADIDLRSQLARSIVAMAGESPIVSTGKPRELAWARRSKTRTYLFVINDNDQDATIHLGLGDPSALGIDPAASYTLTEALGGAPLAAGSGQALIASGIDVNVAALSPALVVIETK